MKYIILWNGNKPFCVDVIRNTKEVIIYKQEYDAAKNEFVIGNEIYRTFYTHVFFGNAADEKEPYHIYKKGCSLLVHVADNNYISIGREIYSFKTANNEKIIKYNTSIGNSEYVYHYAIGENNTYLLNENVYINNTELDLQRNDIYMQYYAHGHAVQANKGKAIKKAVPPQKNSHIIEKIVIA